MIPTDIPSDDSSRADRSSSARGLRGLTAVVAVMLAYIGLIAGQPPAPERAAGGAPGVHQSSSASQHLVPRDVSRSSLTAQRRVGDDPPAPNMAAVPPLAGAASADPAALIRPATRGTPPRLESSRVAHRPRAPPSMSI